MKRKIQFYEDVEQLNYYIYHDGKFQLPSFWNYLDKCDDKKTGMYAEVYKSPEGEIVMIVRAAPSLIREGWGGFYPVREINQ